MRVIHTIPGIILQGGSSGPSYAVMRLCESLIAKDQKVILAAVDRNQRPLLNCSFLKLFSLGFGPDKLGRSPEMQQWIDAEVKASHVDLIHNHGLWQMNAIYPCKSAEKGKINLVVSPHGAFSSWAMQSGSVLKKLFWPLLQYPALQQATCFHATSEAEYEDIRRLGFRQPVAIIPYGIDVPVLPVNKKSNFRTLLFLARLHRIKGLEILLQSWSIVQNHFPDWQLVIAGADSEGGSYVKKLLALSQELGLKRIEFIGEQIGIDKLNAYQSADLYVLPSYTENFAFTVAESLAAGVPAIVSRGAPWGGLCKHKAGWWIDISVDSLSICLKEALAYLPKDLNEMGLRGRRWMEADFLWLDVGEQMLNTYQWLLDRTLPVPACVNLN